MIIHDIEPKNKSSMQRAFQLAWSMGIQAIKKAEKGDFTPHDANNVTQIEPILFKENRVDAK